MGSYDWDVDLPEGQVGEDLVRDLFTGNLGPIEVKRDALVSDSGNIAVEFECRGRPSGIETTKATWWAFVLSGQNYNDEIVIMIDTKRLRAMCNYLREKGDYVPGGDDKQSKMVLLYLGRLLLWNPILAKVRTGQVT